MAPAERALDLGFNLGCRIQGLGVGLGIGVQCRTSAHPITVIVASDFAQELLVLCGCLPYQRGENPKP